MVDQRIHKPSSWNPPIQKKSSSFAPHPLTVQAQQDSSAPLTQEEIENEAFDQNKFEANGLQLKAERGTITPVEQERLGVLQAKKADYWAKRRERASRFTHNFAHIPIHAPVSQGANPEYQPKLLIPAFQPKLTIGQPGDRYEQEADRVASKVVEQIHAPAPTPSQNAEVQRQELEDETLQTKVSAADLAMKPKELLQREAMEEDDDLHMKPMVQRVGAEGSAVSADFQGEINAARGGGQRLAPELQAQMGQAMGADFSRVRVHTDARADQLNRSVRARAFTTGQDLFFRRGEYQPGSRGGQELIAHELTHVVQQGTPTLQRRSLPPTERPDDLAHDADAMNPKQDASEGLIQRSPVETDFGTFTDETYTQINTQDDKGVKIKLTFDPNKKVNATKIGMVQSVKSYKGGVPYALNGEQAAKTVTKKGKSKGYKLDRLTGTSNPIYGAEDLTQGQTLADTKETDDVNDPNYKLGYRQLVKGQWKKQKAQLYDTPHLRAVPNDSGQLFESTALAIDGKQKGTYYGSVSWGWTVDGQGQYQQKKLELSSLGDPTSKFLDAAEKWNDFEILPNVTVVNASAKLYKTTAPLDVTIKIYNKPISFTLSVNSYFRLTDSFEENQRRLDLGNEEISFDTCGQFVTNFPLDKLDRVTRKASADATFLMAGPSDDVGESVTVKAGTQLMGGEDYESLKVADGYLKNGSMILSGKGKVYAGVDKDYIKRFIGMKTTKLPIPE